ncbi:hypothetical protein PTKIN_Ptkin04bG0033500 [Pterospermum kingtungense]
MDAQLNERALSSDDDDELQLELETFYTKTLDLVEGDVKREWGNWLRDPNHHSTNLGGERWLRDEGGFQMGDMGTNVKGKDIMQLPIFEHIKSGGVSGNVLVSTSEVGLQGIDDSSGIELDLVDDRKKKRRGLRVMQAQYKDMEVDSLTLQKSSDVVSSGDG